MSRIASITAENLYQLMKLENIGLIDVREFPEYRKEHITNAINCPLSSMNIDEISKFKKVAFYCRSGHRSAIACEDFWQKNPNVEILDLEGGIEAWKNSGLQTALEDFDRNVKLSKQVNVIIGISSILGVLLGIFVHQDWFIIPLLMGVILLLQEIVNFSLFKEVIAAMPWNK